MRMMNCRNVRREIEELSPGEMLISGAAQHLGNCAGCRTFSAERAKLREMVSSLGIVEAPGDFDFRLRARLAAEKNRSGARSPIAFGSFSSGFRNAAFAATMLVFGSTLFLVSMRTAPDDLVDISAPTGATAGATAGHPEKGVTETTEAVAASNGLPNTPLFPGVIRNSPAKSSVRSHRGQKSRDMQARPAAVLQPDQLTARNSDFPINTSRRAPLKVSLDDGQGSARTISLPTVSFGSQRVLAQGASPLMASARGVW